MDYRGGGAGVEAWVVDRSDGLDWLGQALEPSAEPARGAEPEADVDDEAQAAPIRSRLESCLLGQAIGDSVGLPYAGMGRSSAHRRWERFRSGHSFFLGAGSVSAGTDQAAMAIQSLWLRGASRSRFARAMRWRLRFWAPTLPAGLDWASFKASLRMWLFLPTTASRSAGGEPLSRAVAIGAFFPGDAAQAMAFAKRACLLTHSDPQAIAACQALAAIASQCAAGIHDDKIDFAAVEKALFAPALEPSPEWSSAMRAAILPIKDRRYSFGWKMSLYAGRGHGVAGPSVVSAPFAIYLWAHHSGHGGGMRRLLTDAILAGGDVALHAGLACALAGASWANAAMPEDLVAGIADWPLSKERLGAIGRGEARSLRLWPLAIGWALRSLPMMAALGLLRARRLLPWWRAKN